jgi:hypothetical protein
MANPTKEINMSIATIFIIISLLFLYFLSNINIFEYYNR